MDAYRRRLDPVDALVTLTVRIGRASSHTYASSSWTRCEVVGRGQTHRAPYILDNSALSSIEARNRVWASRTAEPRRAALPTDVTILVDPERFLLVHKGKLGRIRNFRLL